MDMSEFILGGGAGGLFGEKRWIFHVHLAFVAVSCSQRVTAGRRTRLKMRRSFNDIFSATVLNGRVEDKTLSESEITRSDFEADSTGERKLPKSKISGTKKNLKQNRQTSPAYLRRFRLMWS